MNKNIETIRSIFGNGSYATRMYVNRGRFWFACKENYKLSPNKGELKIITPGSILKSLFSQNKIDSEYTNVLALQFGEETRHGIIDIDSDSKYRNDKFVDEIYSVCDALEIKVMRLQSSNSGGWHFLFTFKEMTKSLVVYKLLASIAYLSGAKGVKNGQCEIYPNPKRKTQKVRMPGQIEQYLMDMNFDFDVKDAVGGNFTRMDHREKIKTLEKLFNSDTYSNEKSRVEEILIKKLALSKPYLFNKKTDLNPIDELLETEQEFNKRTSENKFKNNPLVNHYSGKDLPEIRLDLEIVKNYNSKREDAANFFNDLGYAGINLFNRGVNYYKNGISDFGTRLDALISIGYALYFSGYGSSERESILTKWISEKHNNRSKDWSKKPELVMSQIKELSHWSSPVGNPEGMYIKLKNDEYGDAGEEFKSKKIKFERKCENQAKSNRLAKAMSVAKVYCAVMALKEAGYAVNPPNITKIVGVARATIYRIKDEFGTKSIEGIYKNIGIERFIKEFDNEVNLSGYREGLLLTIKSNIKEKHDKLVYFC